MPFAGKDRKEGVWMKFYTFGDKQKERILLLPGTCCHWKGNFGDVIHLLESDFYVICVSYDGFDETEDTTFPDMLTETEKIERYIQQNFDGHICVAYGCSLGGSFVGLLVQRNNIRIDHAILGSSDLDQSSPFSAKLKGRLVSKILYKIFQTGKLPGWMQKRLDKTTPEERAYTEPMLKMFGVGSRDMAFVKKESIYNQFYSDLVTPLADDIDLPETKIHIFYATKMGEKYEKRYRQHFKNPDIRRHDLQHEELLVCQRSNWVAEILQCCRGE
jgi:pimeloyl-ACP methyl ester carboxylesterase